MNHLRGLAFVLLICVGCGPMTPPPVAEPVGIQGIILGGDGKGIGDVSLNLEPLEAGYSKKVEVKGDGKFECDLTPGKYAYSFSPKAGAKGVPKAFSAYLEPNMDRTVHVVAGKTIEIKLAP